MMATVNGTRIAFTDEGHGFPLIFLHGFPYNRDVWSKQVEAFKPQFRVIAPDLRGFGESEASFGPTSLHHFAEDLHALMDHLVTGPVVLAGQAMGGLVALAYAHAFPRLVRGLVLVGIKARPYLSMAEVITVASTAQKTMGTASSPGMEGGGARPLQRKDGVSWEMDAGEKKAGSGGVGHLIETLRVPILVVAGSDDPSIPIDESLVFASPAPGAQFNLIPHAGQLVAFEQAETFNQIVMNWLAWGSQR
ncbi:MAG: alpha/beta hydrolase [Acidobacteria bacterium]|nr:alpha/beta hydrolase [Acidobacteriota bacterium]MBI3487214.1 alpha/beta hydrolase [Acidobacteriota bacterium]